MARILSTNDKPDHSQSDESEFVDNNTERGQEMVFHNNAFMKKTIQNRYGGILTRRRNNSKKNDGNGSNKKSDTNSNRDSALEKFFREHGKDIISSNRSTSTSFIRDIIKEEFPTSDNVVPSPTELVQFGNKEENDGSYKPGDWVELEGHDYIWRVDMITRSFKKAPDEWDWNDPQNKDKEPEWTFTYNAGNIRNIKHDDLRAPEAGLKLIFGSRPWVWQQWAILKVEDKLRFQRGHQNDFATMDVQKLSAALWDQWLNDERNKDFHDLFYDERVGEWGRTALVNHIQKPFQLIDKMNDKEDTEWNFSEDDNINVFTYLSLLGGGLSIPLVVLLIQVAIPTILILESNKRSTIINEDSICPNNGDLLPNDLLYTKGLALCIFLYYTFSVMIDSYNNLFHVVGAGRSVYSRILSLRRLVWFQGDDTMVQMFGFKIDIYMNTAYQVLLMIFNIFLILEETNPLDVVLNSLAFIFIARIDEEIAQSGWFDPDRRFLTAGAMSTAMQSTIQLRVLSSPELFSQKFNIPKDNLMKYCDKDANLFHNEKVARADASNLELMTDDEQINMLCMKVAHETRNTNALQEYKKAPKYFGSIETMLGYIGLSYSKPIFEKFTAWRTWSRWEKVLYLSPVPNLDAIFIYDESGLPTLKSDDVETLLPSPYANFYPDESKSDLAQFINHFWSVIFFQRIIANLKPVFGFKYILGFLFRLFDAIFLHWPCYVIHIFFPIYLIVAIGTVTYNLITQKCLNLFATVLNGMLTTLSNWLSGSN